MATAQRRKKREAFLDANGRPLAGGYLKYYRGGTTIDLITYSDAAGTIPNTATSIPSRPDLGALLPLDASGFTIEPVYLGPSYTAKEVLLDATLASVANGIEDNIPSGIADFVAPTYSLPQQPWTSVSVSSVLQVSDAGKAFAVTTANLTIVMTLPNATTIGNGRGFIFKKLGAGGVLRLAGSSGQFVDGQSTRDMLADGDAAVLVSDGANWVRAAGFSALFGDLGAPIQGDIPYRSSTAWQKLAIAASGLFLRSNGAGADPSWSPGGLIDVKAFTTAGAFTWTKKPNTTKALFILTGGGGGYQGASGATAIYFQDVSAVASMTGTVGAGGLSGGGSGGSTVLNAAATVTANGNGNGSASATNGTLNITGSGASSFWGSGPSYTTAGSAAFGSGGIINFQPGGGGVVLVLEFA